MKLALLLLLLLSSAATAAEVQNVQDGMTIELSDGRVVRLAGIITPLPPAPLAEEAKAALEKLAMGKELTLHPANPKPDRYGRLLADLKLGSESITSQMLATGWAQAFPATGKPDYAAERSARAQKTGLWADKNHRVLNPEETNQHLDSWRVVEGKVLSAALTRRGGYLNFGADYKTDFTITLPPRLAQKLKPESLVGQTVRVRGWLTLRNGPAIELTNLSELELPSGE